MSEAFRSFTAGRNDAGRRLDRILRLLLPSIPLSGVYAALRKGDIRLRGKKAAPSALVAENDSIQIRLSLLGSAAPDNPSLPGKGARTSSRRNDENARNTSSSGIERFVIHRSPDILALDKPRGMLVHGGDDSLEASVRVLLHSAASESLSFTPGPLHRLDRNTSGLILFSGSIRGAHEGTALFREGRIGKYYLAVADGLIRGEETWFDTLIRDRTRRVTETSEDGTGVSAETRCYPLERSNGRTLCLLSITSGRTHQIRAQASGRGHPLSGDAKYGGSPFPGGYILHSWGIVLPEDNPVFGFRSLSAPLFPETLHRLEREFGKGIHKKLVFHAILEANL